MQKHSISLLSVDLSVFANCQGQDSQIVNIHKGTVSSLNISDYITYLMLVCSEFRYHL